MPEHETQTVARVEEAAAHPATEGAASESAAEGAEHAHRLDWREISRIVFVAVAAGAAWFLGPKPGLSFVIAAVVCTLVGGYPIFHEAIENILERRMTMERWPSRFWRRWPSGKFSPRW
jgi:cation transport ATPase